MRRRPGDVDDRSALRRDHAPGGGDAAEKRPLGVDGENGVPIRLGELFERSVGGVSGIVDQHVQGSQRIADRPDHAFDGFAIGDIGLDRDRAAAKLPDLPGNLLGGDDIRVRNHRDIRAFGRQLQGDCPANPLATSGYDGYCANQAPGAGTLLRYGLHYLAAPARLKSGLFLSRQSIPISIALTSSRRARSPRDVFRPALMGDRH